MVAKAESLYTLPAVAMEVLRLTDSEQVDTQALKECIERDPALAAKVLKVVNSSLFALSGKVENLTQAIALLGIKPLKLLVLGFSLPDELLADLDAEQLQNYWRGALTRAVTARQLSETMWQVPGDDVFLVALLQDIGTLVLLQQVGTPYARFLAQVRNERGRLVDFEHSALGFHHRELTVALLRKWQLPDIYTSAMLEPPTRENMVNSRDPRAMAQVLRLANLLAELVDEHHLQILPELLELGEQYCGMTKDDLSKLVAELEPQIEQLATALQVQLADGETYASVLAAAQKQLAREAEGAAAMLMQPAPELCDQVLSDACELQRAVRNFTQVAARSIHDENARPRAHAAQTVLPGPRLRATTHAGAEQSLLADLTAAAAGCRQRREPLSLLLFDAADDDAFAGEIDRASGLQSTVKRIMVAQDLAAGPTVWMSPTSFAIVLPSVDRREAVEAAQQLAAALVDGSGELATMDRPVQLKAGAASIAAIPKGFEPNRLLTAAHRCLAAAQASGGTATKSIEVY